MTRQSVSACIIAANEQERLPAALESVAFCDEVVVVDGGSRDDSVAVARTAGARVIENPWPGFAAQRNVAIDHAASEWILEVDADERVSPALAVELLQFLESPPADVLMGALPLRDHLLGRPIGPSARYPKYRLRLFRRSAFRHDESRVVHEGLQPKGVLWPFDGDLEHCLAGTWTEALSDAWRYARLEAVQAPRQPSIQGHARSLVARPMTKLGYRLIVLGGWRDGWRGLLKIGLDVGTDVVVAGSGLLARGESSDADGHYGAMALNAEDAPRVVAVASGAAVSGAVGWLERARSAGADVRLICDAGPDVADSGLRPRRVTRLGPFELARALDAEQQLRPIEALVPFGSRATRVLKVSPVRGRSAIQRPDGDPATTVARISAQRVAA